MIKILAFLLFQILHTKCNMRSNFNLKPVGWLGWLVGMSTRHKVRKCDVLSPQFSMSLSNGTGTFNYLLFCTLYKCSRLQDPSFHNSESLCINKNYQRTMGLTGKRRMDFSSSVGPIEHICKGRLGPRQEIKKKKRSETLLSAPDFSVCALNKSMDIHTGQEAVNPANRHPHLLCVCLTDAVKPD